jgi:hypothetical protein
MMILLTDHGDRVTIENLQEDALFAVVRRKWHQDLDALDAMP